MDLKRLLPVPQSPAGLGFCLLYLDADCDGNVVHTIAWKICFTLISPAFLAGIMLGCKDMEQGKPIELKHLFIAFKTNPAPLITIGGIYLIGQILIIGLVMLIGGSQMTDMLLYEKESMKAN